MYIFNYSIHSSLIFKLRFDSFQTVKLFLFQPRKKPSTIGLEIFNVVFIENTTLLTADIYLKYNEIGLFMCGF